MKFSIKNLVNNSARLGSITELTRLPEIELQTPILFLYTKGGSIPHISHEVFDMMTSEPQAIQVSLPSTYHMREAVKRFQKGMANFNGLQDSILYCSVQDPAKVTPNGFNRKTYVSIWSNNGRTGIEPKDYMGIMEGYQPDIYQSLCNGDTNLTSSKKANVRAVETTIDFFEECLKHHLESPMLRDKAFLGVLEGGYDLDLREKCIKALLKPEVSGYVIDGLHNNGPDLPTINKVKPIVEKTLSLLPPDKLRVIHGGWKPDDILQLVLLGVDAFDSSLAYMTTEKKSAFTFKAHMKPFHEAQEDPGTPSPEISLEDVVHKEDFGPLLEGCSCVACTNHTRAYIHHLVSVNELLASILLMLHNTHHLMEFFKTIRSALSQNLFITLS